MSPSPAAARRFARQILLAEIGETGQEHLSSATFCAGPSCDPSAFVVAADYLERAGCTRDDVDGTPLDMPSSEAVDRFAGEASLRGPAAAVLGAFAAVEHIKRVAGAGTPAAFPTALTLQPDPER